MRHGAVAKTVRFESFCLQQLIQELMADYRPVMQHRDLGVELFFSYELPDLLAGNLPILRTVLSGLIERHLLCENCRTIGVGVMVLEQDDEQVQISITISDYGSDNSIAQICRYGDDSADLPERLSGCQGDADLLGAALSGGIAVDAPYSRLVVRFASAQPEESSSGAGTVGVSVLVVEDNAINQRTLATILQKLGFTVCCAHNGREAVDICSNNRMDLVLMDIHMPVMGGVEALHLIRENELRRGTDERVPIIALTADAVSGTEENLLCQGFDLYISKPVTICELVEKLQQVIEAGAA